jgi:hypothetical protein
MYDSLAASMGQAPVPFKTAVSPGSDTAEAQVVERP